MPGLPANPMSIQLTVTHERLWWHVDEDDEQPEQWSVSADVWRLDRCYDDLRHVADMSIAIADLHRSWHVVNPVAVGEWALKFIAETVVDLAEGRLLSEVDTQISDGPARMLILRDFRLTEPWRGHGLAGPLVASALRMLAPWARLAACRVSPADFACGDQVAAELASVRVGGLLERIGFRLWRDVHIVDLNDHALRDARMDFFDRWSSPRSEPDLTT